MCEVSNNSFSGESKAFGYWPKELLCGAGELKLGKCNEDGECVCDDGYTHDMLFMRYRDCTVPKTLLSVFYGVQIAGAFAAFVFISLNLRTAVSLARLVHVSNMIGILVFLIYCIMQVSFEYKMNSFSFAALYCCTMFISFSANALLYSVISPLSTVAQYSSENQKKFLGIVCICFRIILAVPLFIAIINYGDSSDPRNDQGWSDMASIFSFLLSFESIFLGYFLVIYGTKMVKLIESISNNLQSDPEKPNKVSRTYLTRVKILIFRVKMIIPPCTLMQWIVPITHLVTGYFVFQYIPNFLATGNLLLIPLFMSKFAITSSSTTANVSSRSNSRTVKINSLISNQHGDTKSGKYESGLNESKIDATVVSLSNDVRNIQ